jgi:hypothetical protein
METYKVIFQRDDGTYGHFIFKCAIDKAKAKFDELVEWNNAYKPKISRIIYKNTFDNYLKDYDNTI